jgi:hypothetical protein
MVSYSVITHIVESALGQCQPVAFAEMPAAQRKTLVNQLCLDMLEALQSVALKLDASNLEHSLAVGRTFLIHSLSHGLPPMDAEREGVLRLDEKMALSYGPRFTETGNTEPLGESAAKTETSVNAEPSNSDAKQHFIRTLSAMLNTPLPEEPNASLENEFPQEDANTVNDLIPPINGLADEITGQAAEDDSTRDPDERK